MKEFKFPSSSSSKIYATIIHDNGLLSCDCPGWTVKKLDKVRECKHTKKVATDEGLILEERDGQWFVSGAATTEGVQSSPSPAHGDRTTAPLTSIKSTKEAVEVKADPGFVSPMLASAMPEGKTADTFNSDWVMEEKFDGHRLMIRVESNLDLQKGAPSFAGRVTAWSRLGNTRTLPAHINTLMTQMPNGVYDGELIVPSSQHSYSVTAGQSTGLEALVLFDMLETQGNSLMKNEQHVRRAFLEIAFDALSLPKWGEAVRLAPQFPPTMAAVTEIWMHGGEGAIIKKLSGRYNPGWRSPDWIKVKAILSATLTIIGYSGGKNGPYSVVKLRDKDGIETTVKTLDNQTMRDLANDPTGYVGKRLVISYQEKMPSGKYRHPMFDHFAGEGE